jgi:hypothetical protein
VGSRPAWATKGNPVLKINKNLPAPKVNFAKVYMLNYKTLP